MGKTERSKWAGAHESTRVANEFQRLKSVLQLLHAFAVFDYQIDALQKIDVMQHIASYRDNVGELAFTNRAVVFVYFHHHSRPVGCGANSSHRVDAETIDPRVQFVPGGLARIGRVGQSSRRRLDDCYSRRNLLAGCDDESRQRLRLD